MHDAVLLYRYNGHTAVIFFLCPVQFNWETHLTVDNFNKDMIQSLHEQARGNSGDTKSS